MIDKPVLAPSPFVEFPESFRELFEAALAKWAPGERFQLLQNLQGGKSGSPVLRLDIHPDGLTESHVPSGEYILKMQEHRAWDKGDLNESERHRQAQDANSDFATRHIPSLVDEHRLGDRLAILYEIAGFSLEDYCTGYAACDTKASSLLRIGQDVLFDLLAEWNRALNIQKGISTRQLFRDWLGYRLDPAKAPRLHGFVAERGFGGPMITISHVSLPSPLWLATCDEVVTTSEGVAFVGIIHGDLHLGNLLLHRESPKDHPFWLIDFALARRAPLGYDHAYFELALILHNLRGKTPERLFTILKATEGTAEEPEGLGFLDTALVSCLRALRESSDRWQRQFQLRRSSSWKQQMLLARAAVGLNWTNKQVDDENDRMLAFAYGAWAARTFLSTYHPDLWQLHGTTSGPGSSGAGETAEVKHDDEALQALWTEIWEQSDRFDESRSRFVLISGLSGGNTDFASLGMLPWSAVIDLDPQSEESGLFKHAAPILERIRSLHTFGTELVPVEFHRGTAWMMAGGWSSRFESEPLDLKAWRRSYLKPVSELFDAIRRALAPFPIKVIVLPGSGTDPDRINMLLNEADLAFKDDGRILLLGEGDKLGWGIEARQLPLPPSHFVARIRSTYGTGAEVPEPTIPGADAKPVAVPIERLRWLQEDLDVLHSRVLVEARGRDREGDEFWRGNQPSWFDLDQGVDAPREITAVVAKTLLERLLESRNFTLPLYHHPGAGGTTVSYRAAWSLRDSHPTAVLRRYSERTVERLDELFHRAQRPVLLVADASLLTASDREKMYRDLADRNARVVILYVVRTTQRELGTARPPQIPGGGMATGPAPDPERTRLVVSDPLGDAEAQQFFGIYSKRTTDRNRLAELNKITFTNDDEKKRYRLPFFYGLYTYEHDFKSLDDYVAVHLSGARYNIRQVILYLALVTRYSQTGIQVALVRKMLEIRSDSQLDLEEVFGPGPFRLILRQGDRIKLMHPLIATEVLRQGLGGETDGDLKDGLHSLALDFIEKVVHLLGSNAEEVHHLFIQMFITRAKSLASRDSQTDFAELIEAMTNAGGHRILEALTIECPHQAHYWNHLGRHHIYRMKRDFKQAEAYLERAIQLSKDDALHHHTLGMVRRFWIEQRLGELTRKTEGHSSEAILQEIEDLYDRAAMNFFDAREINETDDHGYITHVQMVLTIAQALRKSAGSAEFSKLSSDPGRVARWLRDNVTLAESLLSRVRHQRARSRPSFHEMRCYDDLEQLYDNFDTIIQAWEVAISQEPRDPRYRRALAHAYFARKKRAWCNLSTPEIKRIADLMDSNLHQDPSNEGDLRMWFQAYRRLPSFNVINALARLEGWAARNDSLDSHYYLYILHYLNFRDGTEQDERQAERSLRRCRELAKGKRSHVYEWLATEPDWCPLVHFTELGEWDEEKRFYTNTSSLARVNGVIMPFEHPQSGTIRISPYLSAFFVPGKEIRTADTHKQVNFDLGFSYDGLRAWQVRLGPALESEQMGPTAAANVVEEIPLPSTAVSAALASLRDRAHRLVCDLVSATESAGQDLQCEELEARLAAIFGGRAVHLRFGYNAFEDFLGEVEGIKVQRQTGRDLVMSGKRFSGDTARQDVTDYVVTLVREAGSQSHLLTESFLVSQLRHQYPGSTPIHERLGYANFADFIRSCTELRWEGRPDGVEFAKWAVDPAAAVEAAVSSVPLSAAPPSSTGEPDQAGEMLRERVTIDALSFIDEAAANGIPISVLDERLRDKYGGSRSLWERLGCVDISTFLHTIKNVSIQERAGIGRAYLGMPPARPAQFTASQRETRSDQAQIGLRNRVEAFIVDRINQSVGDGKRYLLSQLGSDLKITFPGSDPVFKRLGYPKLADLVGAIHCVKISGAGGAQVVERCG